MNPTLLRYYSQELQHLREMGAEFAREFPKIAGRLGLDGFDCTDPYVERLLEGFSFLAARVQLKMDAEFPRFTQHLMELVYPHYLAPTPSMVVVQLQPDLSNPDLAQGVAVPRGTGLRSLLGKDDATACEYRTGHDVTLWPMTLLEAKFVIHNSRSCDLDLHLPPGIKSCLRLRIRAEGGISFKALALDKLCLYIRGNDNMPARIYEQILAGSEGVLVTPAGRSDSWHTLLPKTAVQAVGFDEEHALLPSDRRTFQGYRLLQEYFAFAPRFLFVQLVGLQAAMQRCDDNEIELMVLLNRSDTQLEQVVDISNFSLNCTPAINLFQHRADRIHVSDEQFEFHVIPDRTRPLDFEIYRVEEVVGYGTGPGSEQVFHPFYTAKDADLAYQPKTFFQLRREKRMTSERQRRIGQRSSYIGSEVFISLVDATNAHDSLGQHDLRQLGIALLCTNRDLPLSMPLGVGKTDFTLDSGAPVQSVRCLAGPSQPKPSFAQDSNAWRVLSHFSLNYLSLVDIEGEQGAQALRELLSLYCTANDTFSQCQIEGVRSVQSERITRRMPSPGPITFGRGIQVIVTLDDTAFEEATAFLLGAVLDRFFAQYVSINTFTETVVKTVNRGEIMRWPIRSGRCTIL